MIGGIHPNPGPIDTNLPYDSILQFNCNGIKNTRAELSDLLHNRRIGVACLQETKPSSHAGNLSFPDYYLLRRDRPAGSGGGLAFLIHHSIPFTNIDTSFILDQTIEVQSIAITIDHSPLIIYNVYVPPASSCPLGYSPDLSIILNRSGDDTLIVGDFNARHLGWFSTTTDARGDLIASEVENGPYCVLNCDTPTRLPRHGNPSSPDISIVAHTFKF